ncbi:hypothetical protein CHUAL_009445 [Chamberlinius hualienensis]
MNSMSKWEITSQILQQKLVDIVIAATVITPAREQLVDILVPFHTEDFAEGQTEVKKRGNGFTRDFRIRDLVCL